MSTIEPSMAADEQASEPPAPVPAGSLPRFETPIVPKATIAGRALVAVIAIMTFLASLTTGAVMLVRAAAVDWQSEVSREITVQIRRRPAATSRPMSRRPRPSFVPRPASLR